MKKSLPNAAFRTNSAGLMKVTKGLEYKSSEDLYLDPKAYEAFIGSEIDGNAKFGVDIIKQLIANGRSAEKLTFIETAAGSGSSIRDLNKVVEDCELIALEISKPLCEAGKEKNSHIDFRTEDMIPFNTIEDGSTDFIFNSASSLGFLSIRQLLEHFKGAARVLKKNGSYFADMGWYSCIQAANLNWVDIFKHREGKNLVRQPQGTHAYYPLTDRHHIGYSTWTKTPNGNEFKFSEAYEHSLRAYRFSEIEFLAELAGLEARLWLYDYPDDESKPVTFKRVTENFKFTETDDCSCLMIELHHPDATLLTTEEA